MGRRPRLRSRAAPLAAALTAVVLIAALVMGGLPGTAALFTGDYPVGADIAAGRIYPGQRDTPAFRVTDASGGSPTDASSAIAYFGDGLTATTSNWATGFGSDRYLEFEMNTPLPAGLTPVSASFSLAWASASAGSTACYYFEVRSRTSGTVLETLGGVGAPVACVTGTTPETTSTPLPSVAGTDIADDLVLRVFGRDSTGGGAIIDAATVAGDDGLATFTLYPVELLDAADTTPGISRWGPAGP